VTADGPQPDWNEKSARGKLAYLHRLLGSLGSALVAFSGGVDSAFLAFMAHQALGDQAIAVTADSPSLARSELRDAIEFTRLFGMRHRVIPTSELEDEAYVRNAGDRCYFCKNSLMRALAAIGAEAADAPVILVGVNTDDLGDYRPGQQAVQERGGRWPLVEAGLSKAEIRWLSKELGLPTWDKPAAACLSSRLAYGIPVTTAALRRIEAAEDAVRNLGLSGRVRVRDQGGDLARIELDPDSFDQVLAQRVQIVAALRAAGFLFVTLDLEGYRQGSHNRSLPLVVLSSANGTKTAVGHGDLQKLHPPDRK
jgi:pyridinium-3,5-biscarboxylic acid mononucleotide sulfurtransferase